MRRSDPAPPTDAQDTFRAGLAEYDAHHYARAIEIFSQLYDQTHTPALLFNIAQAWRLLGDCPAAVARYEAFIAADPTSPDVSRARDWLDKLGRCPESSAAPIRNDEVPKIVPLQPAAVATSDPKVLSTRPPADTGRAVFVGVLTGASVVLAATGSYAAWRANDLSNETAANFMGGGVWNQNAAAVEHEGRKAQTEAIVLLASAFVCGLAAFVIHRLSASPVQD